MPDIFIDDLPSVDELPNVDGTAPPTVLTASTISFTAPSTIGDTGNGLDAFEIGDVIDISGAGAGANAGLTVTVATVAAGLITVDEATITAQAAGGSVTLESENTNPIAITGMTPGFENPNPGSPVKSTATTQSQRANKPYSSR